MGLATAMIGLQTAIAMSHNSCYGLSYRCPSTKAGQMQHAQDMTMYQISAAQKDYYRKLLSKNIKSSFSYLA